MITSFPFSSLEPLASFLFPQVSLFQTFYKMCSLLMSLFPPSIAFSRPVQTAACVGPLFLSMVDIILTKFLILLILSPAGGKFICFHSLANVDKEDSSTYIFLCVWTERFFYSFGYQSRNGRVTLHFTLGELPSCSSKQLPLDNLGGFQSLHTLVNTCYCLSFLTAILLG